MRAKAKKHRKPAWRWMRYRKHDLAHNVQVAVQRWVHANKGTAVVMGAVSIITMPDARPEQYYVAIGCMGRRPEKPKKSECGG